MFNAGCLETADDGYSLPVNTGAADSTTLSAMCSGFIDTSGAAAATSSGLWAVLAAGVTALVVAA